MCKGATKLKRKKCRNPGSNQGPLDLQSNALPTELFRQLRKYTVVIRNIFFRATLESYRLFQKQKTSGTPFTFTKSTKTLTDSIVVDVESSLAFPTSKKSKVAFFLSFKW